MSTKDKNANPTGVPNPGVSANSVGDIDLIKDSMEKAGKSKEEVGSVVTIDQAQIAADKGRAKPGVLQQALLAPSVDLRLFACQSNKIELTDSEAAVALAASIEVGKRHRDAGTLFGEDG